MKRGSEIENVLDYLKNELARVDPENVLVSELKRRPPLETITQKEVQALCEKGGYPNPYQTSNAVINAVGEVPEIAIRKVGRHGRPTRLEFQVKSNVFGKAIHSWPNVEREVMSELNGPLGRVSAHSSKHQVRGSENVPDLPPENLDVVTYKVPLSRTGDGQIQIPKNLSSADRNRFVKFLELIPTRDETYDDLSLENLLQGALSRLLEAVKRVETTQHLSPSETQPLEKTLIDLEGANKRIRNAIHFKAEERSQ